MNTPNGEALAQIDALQLRYIDALDSKDMGAWLATFSEADEAAYICTTAENEAAGRAVALIMDDCRGRLEDRVTFVTKVWRGTYQEYQTRHMVQRVRCSLVAPGRYEVRTNVVVAFTPSDTGIARILTTGVYADTVACDGGAATFLSKTFIADAPVLSHYIVYPL